MKVKFGVKYQNDAGDVRAEIMDFPQIKTIALTPNQFEMCMWFAQDGKRAGETVVDCKPLTEYEVKRWK